MTYTQKYHLPQWVKSDRIMMDDFNDAMAGIESGIASAQASADSACSTASAANSKASSAQSTANAAMAARPYVSGSYSGDGGTKSINVGFRPSLVLISGMKAYNSPSTEFSMFFGMTAGTVVKTRCQITSSGFTVLPPGSASEGTYPNFNEANRTYEYIAFK